MAMNVSKKTPTKKALRGKTAAAVFVFFFVWVNLLLYFFSGMRSANREGGFYGLQDMMSMFMSNRSAVGDRWGFCDPFRSPVRVERVPIPDLNMTMFFLGCTLSESTGNLTLTVFMEPDPPVLLDITNRTVHAIQSDNWPHARVSVTLAGAPFACDPPVRRASAVATFECAPLGGRRPADFLPSSGEAAARVYAGSSSIGSGRRPAVLPLCRKGPIRKEVALCTPYLPAAGPDWSTYIRQYIEYHKLAGVDSITMFEHTDKYAEMFERYYKGDARVMRVQWPPLSVWPDKVVTVNDPTKKRIVRECYDQTPLTTYYMVNSDYAWAMVLDSDEYFWDETFATQHSNNNNNIEKVNENDNVNNVNNDNVNNVNNDNGVKDATRGVDDYENDGVGKERYAEIMREADHASSPLFERLESFGRRGSCIRLETVVLLSNRTRLRPFGDQSGVVIEDNDFVCPVNSYLKVACRPDEVYGMEVHVGTTKRKLVAAPELRNLHIKNVWMERVRMNLSKCTSTDKYYKPFSGNLRKALGMPPAP